jgi:succinyl-CoA synthetase beta subunit
MRCDIVAEGIVQASRQLGLKKPIVVRLVGTNVDKGKQIIKDSGMKITAIDDLTRAAVKAVELSK